MPEYEKDTLYRPKTKKSGSLAYKIGQAIALVNRNHRRKKYDAERLSAGSSSHSPRRFTA